MNGSTDLLFVDFPCSEVLVRLQRALQRAGLRSLATFDLQTARSGAAGCACPHHGTAECDCQMIVLLIYADSSTPTSLMLHGSDGRTWISRPDRPGLDVDPLIKAAIEAGIHDGRTAEGL